MIPEQKRPDWVMLGVPRRDGKIAIFASKDLTEAELSHEAEEPDIISWRMTAPYRMPAEKIYLTVQMKTYVMVVADSYAEALDKLLRFWTPSSTEAEQAGIADQPHRLRGEIAAGSPRSLTG